MLIQSEKKWNNSVDRQSPPIPPSIPARLPAITRHMLINRCSQPAHLCINEMCAAVPSADKGSHRALCPGENKLSKWTEVIRGRKELVESSPSQQCDCSSHPCAPPSSPPAHRGISQHWAVSLDSTQSNPFILTVSCTWTRLFDPTGNIFMSSCWVRKAWLWI